MGKEKHTTQSQPEMAKWPENNGVVEIRLLARPLYNAFLQAYQLSPKENLPGQIYDGPDVGDDILKTFGALPLADKLYSKRLDAIRKTDPNRPLFEIIEAAILLGMEQERRIEAEDHISKKNLEMVFQEILAGNAPEKRLSPDIPEVKGWPAKAIIDFSELKEPLSETIKRIYYLQRINPGQDIVYDGYNVGSKTLVLDQNPQNKLLARYLYYLEKEQGYNPVNTIIGICLQIGIENGRRYFSPFMLNRYSVLRSLNQSI